MVSVGKVDEDRHGQTVEDSKMAEGLASPKLQVQSLYFRSFMHTLGGDIARCFLSASSAVELAEQQDDTGLLLRALECLSMALYQQGRMNSGTSVSQRILKIAQLQNFKDFEIVASYQLVVYYHYTNRFAEAVEICDLPISDGERYGLIRTACLANEYVSRTYLSLGRLAEAKSHAEKALDLARSAGMRAREALALIRLSEVARAEGQDKASDYAARAVELADDRYVRPWALAAKARTVNDPNDAAELFSEANQLLSCEACHGHNHFHVRVLQMEDGLEREDWAAIERAADRLESFTKKERLPWTDFHIGRGRVLAAWGRGDHVDSFQRQLAALHKIRRETGMAIWLPDEPADQAL